MKVKLADVAAAAGVSVATVSRVLNGKPGIAEATRREVLQVLEEMGYDRHATRRRVGRIGLIVEELTNPIFPLLAADTQDTLVAHGYLPMLASATPVITEIEHINNLVEFGVAGLIIVSGRHANSEADHSQYHELRAAGLPMVFVNGYAENLDASFVSTDDTRAFDEAYAYARSLGHTRIGCAMGPARYVSSRRKVAGFLRAAAAAHDEPESSLERAWVVYSIYSVTGGETAGASLIDRGATAILCGNDQMALGVIKAARARGLQVPRDLSVIGYDDAQLNAFTAPPLTSIRQNVTALGIAAVNALMHELRHGPHSPEALVDADLIVRGSTGPPPG